MEHLIRDRYVAIHAIDHKVTDIVIVGDSKMMVYTEKALPFLMWLYHGWSGCRETACGKVSMHNYP